MSLIGKCRSGWMQLTGRAHHASNYNYNVSIKVCKQFKTGELVADELLPKLDNKQQKQLLVMICDMANKRRAGHFPDTSQIEEISGYLHYNMHYMTTEFLDRIEQIAIASGLFILAYAIRVKNEDLIQQRFTSSKRDAAKLFWIRLNSLDTPENEALQLIDRSGKRPSDSAFADYIKDKKIAIIGPSSSGVDYNDEIKRDFDIIIRMKYRGRSTLPEAQRDLVPQIAYFRDRAGPWDDKMSTPDGTVDYLKDLDFAVLLKKNEEIRKKISAYTNARTAISTDYFYFSHCKHNMLQAILHDLTHFEPARIKIFNANLYLTDTRHDKGYKPPTYSRGTLDFWYDWAKHNLICQYNYIIYLYKLGLIEADARLAEVLELGTAEYIKQIEEQENRNNPTYC